MLILAIETSGLNPGVALLDDDSSAVAPSAAPGRHARSLVKDADALLKEWKWRPQDVDLVGVSIGPGSFTGLRVGVVFAKTWCYATGAKLVAVDTLLAAAARVPAENSHVFAVADAQRGELFVGEYRRDHAGEFHAAGDIAIVNAAEFAAGRVPREFVTGPGLDRYAELFLNRCPIAPAEIRHPTATVVGQLARRSAQRGGFSDLWTLEPVYIRRSAAEEKWDANAMR